MQLVATSCMHMHLLNPAQLHSSRPIPKAELDFGEIKGVTVIVQVAIILCIKFLMDVVPSAMIHGTQYQVWGPGTR